MFINKISANLGKNTFKGYEHFKNDVGKTVGYFYYPYDYSDENKKVQIEFIKVKEEPSTYWGYVLDHESGSKFVKLSNENGGGAQIDVQKELGLEPNEPYAYRIHIDGYEPRPDTGIQISAQDKDGVWKTYTLVSRQSTAPMTRNGLGALTMVDTHMPGARYEGYESEKTGAIVYSEELQAECEKTKRNTSNKIGGTLAGIEYDIPNLRKKGVTTLYVTPIVGYDTLYYHRYQNKNNKQIADEIGNVDNFASFVRTLFVNGMTYVFDGTFTSEGSEGVNVQYALKHAQENPDALYRFRMEGIQDGPIGFGVVPKNKENLRYKLVNSPYEIQKNDDGKVELVENPEYIRRKPTYYQIYDANLVTEEQANSKELITGYGAPVSNKADKLAINTYQDSIPPQKNQIFDLKIFKITLENAVKIINESNGAIEINSPEAALLIGQTPSFEFSQKNKNVSLWEDKFGMTKRRHSISGNDEKILMSIESEVEREEMRNRFGKGAIQNIDMDVQMVDYWTGKYKDIVTYYTAQTLKNVESIDDIENLITLKKLPAEVRLTAQALENIKAENYYLSPKGEMDRDDVTVKALMKLHLDSLEFGENTVSVLAQNFFTNLAPVEELIGKTRFELEKMGNPHLTRQDEGVYTRVNKLFTHEVKNFADAVVEKLNTQLEEKLLDEDGEYTEYGEYVIEHIGQDIAKYAFLKSLIDGEFINKYTKAMPNGDIKYDYPTIREVTTLEDIGVIEGGMVNEASALQRRIQRGLKNLDLSDVDFLSGAFAKQLKGTTTLGFRVSEAMYDKSSLGLDWRIDALKDTLDIDSVKQLSDTFDIFWDRIISYYQKINGAIRGKNPGSKITGEITDIKNTIAASWGSADMEDFDSLKSAGSKYQKEDIAMRQFWMKSGVTTEANYSHFYSSVFSSFTKDFESGEFSYDISEVIKKLREIVTTRGIDNIRNLFTFVGNHDKPRVLHYTALDMGLFYNTFSLYDKDGKYDIKNNSYERQLAMKTLFGVDKFEDLPLEIKLNINNTDYFRTVSSRAIAMTSLLREGVDAAVLSNVLDKENLKYFKKALADLAEGKCLDYGIKPERATIDIPELQNEEAVITSIIDTARAKYGLNIDDVKRNEWIQTVKNYATAEKLSDYSVQAGRDDIISERIDWIFKTDNEEEKAKRKSDSEYSAYVVTVLAFMKEAFGNACGYEENAMKAFTSVAIDYINKYDKSTINSASKEFPYYESAQNAQRKNGFAAKELEETVMMMIEQAEYYARKDKKITEDGHFKDYENLIKEIYKSIHKAPMEKSIAMAAMLAVLLGIPTEYLGESLGMSGGEEKSNNLYNENRNAIKRAKEDLLKEYRTEMQALYDSARNIRNVKGAEALNIGTTYPLETFRSHIGSWLMQSKDSMTITILTGSGINRDHGQRRSAFHDQLFSIEFPEGLMVPDGTEFENISANNKEIFVAEKYFKESVGKHFTRLRKKLEKGLGDIIMTQHNAPNGTLVLKRIPKNISFGGNINKKFYISAPKYEKFDTDYSSKKVQNFSIIAK